MNTDTDPVLNVILAVIAVLSTTLLRSRPYKMDDYQIACSFVRKEGNDMKQKEQGWTETSLYVVNRYNAIPMVSIEVAEVRYCKIPG